VDEVDFGRYRLIELIGEGPMGRVFKAHDTQLGRDVAIKVLQPQFATEPGYREQFLREAQTAAQLTEPHVIPVLRRRGDRWSAVSGDAVVDGVDLASLLERDGPLSPQLAVTGD
jgi:serine/threonine protein kinase